MAHDTAALVAEYEMSGLTRKAFCAGKGIAVSALQYHCSKINKHTKSDRKKTDLSSVGQFIPLPVRSTGNRATTVVIVRGQFGCGELAELLRTVVE